MLTAVPNFAFAAIWVAEQLKYFEQEGVRVKITPAPSGSVCLNAVVGRSTNFCASTSEGLVLARVEGATAIVMDPLYPHGSAVWGPSPKPREALSPSQLGRQFVPRRMGSIPNGSSAGPGTSLMSGLAGKYVLVLPYEIVPAVHVVPVAS